MQQMQTGSRIGKGAGREIHTAAVLAQVLEADIAAGRLAAGDRLESVRAAAETHGLAANTVAAAYRILGERGLVTGKGRQGTIVNARPAVGRRLDAPVRPDLVDLSSGNPDQALLPDLAEALLRIRTTHGRYGQIPIDPELMRVLSTEYRADGVDASHFVLSAGALDGLERVLGAHLRPGDKVAVEDPGYSSVFELLAALGLEAVPVAVDDEGPIAVDVERALESGVDAIVVTSRAQNPTGAAISEPRADELGQLLSGYRDVLVIEDDHAGLVAGQPFRTISRSDRPRWAVIRSVAKSLGPDLRVASVVGDQITIDRVAGRQAVGPGWVSHLLQRTVVAMLANSPRQNTGQRAALSRASVAYRHRRDLFRSYLSDAGLASSGSSGFNVWVPVPDETAVVAGMQQRGFAIRAGDRYRLNSPPGVRVTVAAATDLQLGNAASALVDVLSPGSGWRSA